MEWSPRSLVLVLVLALVSFVVVGAGACGPGDQPPPGVDAGGGGGGDDDGGAPPPDDAGPAPDGGSSPGDAGPTPDAGPTNVNPAAVDVDDVVAEEDVVVEGTTLIVPADAFDEPQELVGKLVATAAGDEGLLGWVSGVEVIDGQAHIYTTPAGIQHLIQDGEIAAVLDLANGGSTLLSNFSVAPVDLSGTVLYEGSGLTVTLSQGVVQLDGELDVSFSMSGASLAAAHVLLPDAVLTTTAAVQIAATTTELGSISKSATVLRKKFLVPVGGIAVPVVVSLELDVNAEVTATSQFSVELGAQTERTFTAGMRYEGGAWTRVFEPGAVVDTPIGPTTVAELGVDAKATIVPRIKLRFYGLAGPSLELEAGVKGYFSVGDPVCTGTVSAFATGMARVEFDYLFDTETLWAAELFHIETPIVSPPDNPGYQTWCCARSFSVGGGSLAAGDAIDTSAFGCTDLTGDLTVTVYPPDDGEEPAEWSADLSFLEDMSGTLTIVVDQPTTLDLSALQSVGTLNVEARAPLTLDLSQLGGVTGDLNLSVLEGAPLPVVTWPLGGASVGGSAAVAIDPAAGTYTIRGIAAAADFALIAPTAADTTVVVEELASVGDDGSDALAGELNVTFGYTAPPSGALTVTLSDLVDVEGPLRSDATTLSAPSLVTLGELLLYHHEPGDSIALGSLEQLDELDASATGEAGKALQRVSYGPTATLYGAGTGSAAVTVDAAWGSQTLDLPPYVDTRLNLAATGGAVTVTGPTSLYCATLTARDGGSVIWPALQYVEGGASSTDCGTSTLTLNHDGAESGSAIALPDLAFVEELFVTATAGSYGIALPALASAGVVQVSGGIYDSVSFPVLTEVGSFSLLGAEVSAGSIALPLATVADTLRIAGPAGGGVHSLAALDLSLLTGVQTLVVEDAPALASIDVSSLTSAPSLTLGGLPALASFAAPSLLTSSVTVIDCASLAAVSLPGLDAGDGVSIATSPSVPCCDLADAAGAQGFSLTCSGTTDEYPTCPP